MHTTITLHILERQIKKKLKSMPIDTFFLNRNPIQAFRKIVKCLNVQIYQTPLLIYQKKHNDDNNDKFLKNIH